MLKVLDLFAGLGGFSLGLEHAGGFETVAFCESDSYCQKILAKHWPNIPIYDDVRAVNAARLAGDGVAVDVITAGFPCQDVSKAGKMAGLHGSESGLWREAARIIGEIRPRYAVLENVANIVSGNNGEWFGVILGDLAALRYRVEWHCVPASAIGAHCHRDRAWIVAEPDSNGRDEGQPGKDRCEEKTQPAPRLLFDRRGLFMEYRRNTAGEWSTEPHLDRVVTRLPGRLDRVRALGNSITPKMAEYIGRVINGRRA